MQLMFVSDIHGSIHYTKKIINIFEAGSFSHLVILGDILYHGPRNPLPLEYSPKEVCELLNIYKEKIIAIRGNCDSEVDDMVTEFPIMASYSNIIFENRRIFLSHGHTYNEENLPPLSKGDVFAYGHTHIPRAEIIDDKYIINPGSITLPKGGFANSYGILDNIGFKVLDFDRNIIKSISF